MVLSEVRHDRGKWFVMVRTEVPGQHACQETHDDWIEVSRWWIARGTAQAIPWLLALLALYVVTVLTELAKASAGAITKVINAIARRVQRRARQRAETARLASLRGPALWDPIEGRWTETETKKRAGD
jgi:hypothetical protein